MTNNCDLNDSINSSLCQRVKASTPDERAGKIPSGHILVKEKWRPTELARTLRRYCQIIYSDDPGVIDFHPVEEVGVVYMSEADCILNTYDYRRKLAKLRNTRGVRGIVLFESSNMTNQYLKSMQQFAVLDLGLVLMTVANQSEAAQSLWQIAVIESSDRGNPFRIKKSLSAFDESIFETVRTIPGMGEVKAKQLVLRYKSLMNIAEATIEDMTPVIGRTTAKRVWVFFRQK